ncbi:MAG: hypothetical protein A2X25_12715 [Chloroflexi bacterium GWB2_49_20]|nr:MAG: hypothetical protein A2X25_12715 [Chloroflexi bacterium GWB2_49_20]OGN78420.1 MAG: hypothetical protein A2X26_01485 [Chloroflexi bacterium GWC2_49_37]OGN84117.1 MAG: hypothetical protein A2X27_14200 [Chloroflexi bacterium GWD2_49_16]HBG75234.1 hypothetical protein [Anaerolineae bacterium]HCC79131.1 hypothetical protein [Anaerolineae bacterium]
MSEITVSISYFNILASYAGTRKVEVSLPEGATLRHVVEHLDKNASQQLHQVLFQKGEFSKYIKIFLNQQLVGEGRLETPLKNGDEMMIFPAIAGG